MSNFKDYVGGGKLPPDVVKKNREAALKDATALVNDIIKTKNEINEHLIDLGQALHRIGGVALMKDIDRFEKPLKDLSKICADISRELNKVKVN